MSPMDAKMCHSKNQYLIYYTQYRAQNVGFNKYCCTGQCSLPNVENVLAHKQLIIRHRLKICEKPKLHIRQ